MFFKLIGLAALLAVCTGQRIDVEVYYESLCSDSAAFIVEQLHPVKLSPVGKFFDVKFYPFGKANYSTFGADVNFQCQHGPNECYGNKVHACALEHIQVNSYQNTHTRESLILEYVTCLMKVANSFKDSVFPGEKCARDVQLNNWEIIEQCANSTDGSKLLQHYGEVTRQLKPELTSVPTVVFKQQFTQENQNLALSNFRAAICRVLPNPHIPECTGTGGAKHNAAASAIILISLVLFAKMF